MDQNSNFKNRLEAGKKLGESLLKYRGKDTIVLALTRGGVPVGKEVSTALGCPFEPLVIKKIGHLYNPEYAIGAISYDGHMVLNEDEANSLDKEWLKSEIKKRQEEARVKNNFFFKNKKPLNISNKTVIIVDDGIATGLTIFAAIKHVKAHGAKKIIVAVPVAPKETVQRIKNEVDDFISLLIPDIFAGAVGAYYEDFGQVTDEEAIRFIDSKDSENGQHDQDINIKIDSLVLPGILSLPAGTKSLVIFAHGSGSSRFSPRNAYVAQVLQKSGIGTLLFDLLTEEEDETYRNRFEIDLITDRLVSVTKWLLNYESTKNLKMGYFGASTGSAAALKAAQIMDKQIRAVVSRGGRPDLAMDVLKNVASPTLLIVGGNDDVVIGLNQKAFDELKCEKKMEIVAGATHLFEEPGALEKAASIANDWFKKYLI